jgi:VCBS repeat-containing protein
MSRQRNDNPTRPRHHRFALEPRQLFDGAAVTEAAHHADNPLDTQHHDNAPDASKAVFVPPAPVPVPASITAPAPADATAPHEVYVVDSHVQNWQSLVSQLPEGSRVLVLDSQHSGLEQINEALKNDKNITAIHIISHGASDEITLGSDKLNDKTIAQYQQQLETLGEKLTTDGDILLYGCNVTAKDTILITRMADYTHADIAASNDETGSAAKAADWTLESRTGVIETRSLELAYDGVLQAPELTTTKPDMVVSEPSSLHPGAETGSFSGITINASDANVAISVTLTNGAVGDLVNGAKSGKTLEFVGSVADAQAWLNSLKFTASDTELGNQSASTDVQFYILSFSGNDSLVTHVTITPSNDPVTVPNKTLIVPEKNGSGTVISDQILTAVDPDVAAGAQSASQIVYSLTAMPQYGYLTLNGTRLGVGSVYTQQDVQNGALKYVHTATGATQNTTDSFSANVNDGATPIDLSDKVTVTLEIAPENQLPTISGGGIVFEGQPENAVNTGNVGQYIVATSGGDTQDTVLTLTITSLPAFGTLYFKGLPVVKDQQISYAERDQLTYENDGAEGNTQDNFGVRVTDQGGGTGVPASSDAVIALTIQPVDDDPYLNPDSTLHAQVTTGPNNVVLQPEMLAALDSDSSADRVSFIVDTRGLTHGYLTLNGLLMKSGDTFTMEDVAEGRVVYTQYIASNVGGQDVFNFRVIDHSTALRWNADGTTFTRQGGIWDGETANDQLTHMQFTIDLATTDNPNNPDPGGLPVLNVPAETTNSGYIGTDVQNPGNVPHGVLNEGGTLTLSGTGKITADTPGLSYVVQGATPEQIVYTFLGSASGQTGLTILKSDGQGGYQVINAFGTFTQADLNQGLISVRHDGGENFMFDGRFSVSAGQVTLDARGNPVAVTWNPTMVVFVTPINDAPVIAGSSNTVLAEGETVVITNSQLQLSDPDDVNSGASWEGSALRPDGINNNYAYNNDATGTDALKFGFLTLPAGGALQYYNGTTWVTITNADIGTLQLDASILKEDGTSGLRFVSNGSEVRSTSFTTYAVDRWGLQSANNATVGITITNVNDGPKIPQTPDSPDIVVPPDSPNLVGGVEGRPPANNPATVVEGGYVQINSSQLQAYDPDSTPEQVQFTVTTTPTHGRLAYSTDGVNFSVLGDGSTFTQADINNGRIYYLNNGDEVTGNGLNTDGFNFTLSDGDKEQAGNHFAINVTPTNDKPTVTAPSGPIDIGISQAVKGFTIADPDITGTNSSVNILQTTVRLLHSDGSAFSQAEYNGIVLAADAASGATITGGTNGYLVLTGTVAQINSALTGLIVRFPNDRNAVYQVQVITDDRLRTADGQLTGEANGGPVNQPANPAFGASPGLVDSQNYNWYQNAVPGTNGNITANQVVINASSVNDPGHLVVNNPNKSTFEDQPTFIGGDFTITDVESTAFGKPVTVTLTVAQGQLGIGGLTNDSSTVINGVTIQGDNTGTLLLTGTADAIQALINNSTNGLTYQSAANANHDQNGAAAGDVTLNVHLDTSTATVGDTSGFPPADVQVALTIIPVNDPPTVTAPPGALLLDNNAPGGKNVGGFVIGDPDISDAGGIATGEKDIVQVTVRITDENGNPLSVSQYRDQQNSAINISSLNTTSGVIVQTGSPDGVNPPSNGQNAPLVITGTVAQINAYLAQLQVSMRGAILDDADQYFRVEVIVDDRVRDANGNLTSGANGGNNVAANGVGTTLPPNTVISPYAAIPAGLEQNVASTYRTVFQSSINDPAQIVLGGNPALSTNENSATVTLPPITISDSDAGSQTMTVTVKLPNGFVFVAPTGNGGSFTGTGTDTLTFTGSYAQVNTYLAGLRVTLPDAPGSANRSDWNGSFGVTVTVNDGGNSGSRPGTLPGSATNPQQDPGQVSYEDGVGGTSSALITTRAFTFTVNAVNDAPIVVGTPSVTIPTLEEDTLSGAVGGKTVGSLFTGFFNDDRDTINNSANGGTGGSSADSFYGVAITNHTANAAQGEWQYSLDGTTWLAVGNRSDANALVLTANSSLRFVPAPDYFGTPSTLGVRLVETNSNGDVSTTPAVPANGAVTNISGAGGHGGTSIYSEALVTLSTVVTNINDRPTLGDKTITIAEDTNGTQTIGNIFQTVYSDATDNQTAIAGGGNASGPLGYIAIYGDTTDASKGHWEYFNGTTWAAIPSDVTASNAFVLASDTQMRFVPQPDYNGPVTGGLQLRASDTTDTGLAGITNGRVNFFDFAKDSDPTSHWSNTASLSVNITPVTDARDDTFSTHSNVPLVIQGTDLLANDTFSNGDKAVTMVTAPTNGTLSYVNGVLTYTPNPGFVGTDSYIYTVVSGGVEETAKVTINVTNLAPVVGDEIKSIDEDTTAFGNVLTNDSDPDGDALTVKTFTIDGRTYNAGDTATLANNHGTLTMNANGTYTYKPGDDWHGDIAVSYVVTDGNQNGDTTGQLGVHVASVVDARDNIEIEHTGTVITTDVMANDTFVNSDKTVTSFTQPENGVVTLGPNNTLIYTPNLGFIGTDKYTYTVTSGGIEETANVFIFMTNTPPTASNQFAVTDEDTAVSGDVLSLLIDPDGDPLHVVDYQIEGSAENHPAGDTVTIAGSGTFVLNANGSYTFTPVKDWNGIVPTITFNVSDGTATPPTQSSLDITVRPIVDIANDSVSTHAGKPITIDPFINDLFSNPDKKITGVTAPAHGTVTISADGKTVLYTPNAGYVGNDVFNYTVTSGGRPETATITVTMNNAVPVLRSTAGSTLEDTRLDGNLLTTARDADVGDTITVTDFTIDGTTYATGAPVVLDGKGTLTINSNGTYSFEPVADWNGIVPPISFTISDGNNGGQATSTLVIQVRSVVDIAPDTATTHADNFVAINVLGNDTFSNDTQIVTAIRDNTTLGQVFVLSDNTIRYSPPPGFVGRDTFTYTVTSGGITETSTVTVIVTNAAPVTTDMNLSMDEDGAQISGRLTVSDPDSDVVRVTSFQVDGMNGVFAINRFGTGTAVIPGVGTFTLSYDRSYTFTPVADWNGNVPQITYVVTDDNGDTQVSGKVNIFVNPVVDIADDNISLQAGTSSSDNLFTNDTFENSDKAITEVTQGTHGTVVIGSNGIVTYTPQPDYVGTDSYTYTVTSGGRTEIATVNVTVTNTVPVAAPDTQTNVEDTTLVGNVLSNDTDSNATDTLSVTSFTLPGETVPHLAGETVTITGIGALTLNADGSYKFVPVADWNGAVPVVTYNISDGHIGGTASSTLTLVVTEVVDIVDDSSSTHAGVPVTIDVLANDNFENGGRQITATSNGAFGTTTIVNGKVVYTPIAGYVGRDSFTYTVTSGGINETATVTVDMTNTPPVANPDTSTTPEDSTASGNVLANDTDADNADKNTLTVTGFTVNGTQYAPGSTLTLVGMGVLTVQADGRWNFVPVADWNGTLPLVSYQMSDGNTGGVSSASLSITIAPVQDAFNDLISVNGNSSVTSDVLANDTFTNSDKTIVTITQGNHGTVSIENGQITYTPNIGYVGADSYTYTVLSGGILETATVAVRVADLVPIVNPEAVITPENTPISGNVLTNDSDPNGDPLHISVFQVGGARYNAGETALLAGIGSLTVQADGSYTFTPQTNWHGFVPVVTYTVSDGYPVGETNGTLRILVTPSVEISVREDGLTPLDPGAQEVNGTLDILSLDRLQTLTFQGRVITAEQLLRLNPLSPITIETVTGTIKLLAYYSSADGVARLDYNFTLREAVSQPGLVSTHNDYAVQVNGTTIGQLRITVFNDNPTATDDSAEILQDQNQNSASGNLFNDDRIGADGAASNGPVTGVVSENTGNAGTIGGSSGGQYGTLTLDSQGNWRYEVNSSDPRVAALEANATLTEVFVYTITDSDGGVSEARLTILIHGVTAMPNVDDRNGDQIFGREEEETLPAYSQSYEPGLFILPLVYDLQSDAVGLQTRLNSQFAAYGYGIEHANAPVMQQAVLFSRWYSDSREQRTLPGLESNALGQNSLGNSFGPFGIGQADERSSFAQTAATQEATQVEQPTVIASGAQPLSMQLAALEKQTLASGKHITVPTITRR